MGKKEREKKQDLVRLDKSASKSLETSSYLKKKEKKKTKRNETKPTKHSNASDKS